LRVGKGMHFTHPSFVSVSSFFVVAAALLASATLPGCAAETSDAETELADSPPTDTSEDALIACNAAGGKLAFTVDHADEGLDVLAEIDRMAAQLANDRRYAGLGNVSPITVFVDGREGGSKYQVFDPALRRNRPMTFRELVIALRRRGVAVEPHGTDHNCRGPNRTQDVLTNVGALRTFGVSPQVFSSPCGASSAYLDGVRRAGLLYQRGIHSNGWNTVGVNGYDSPVVPINASFPTTLERIASDSTATTFFMHFYQPGTQNVDGAKMAVFRQAWLRAHDVTRPRIVPVRYVDVMRCTARR
jgi:hypothetical protein